MNQPILNTSDNELWKTIATPALFARTASQGKWRTAPHLMAIDRELTEAARTGTARIILTVPPRHGKSELVSKYFPAWYLGGFPDKRIILASYEADFAASWGRKSRTLLEGSGDLFGVKVARDSSAANRWDIEGRQGGMVTAGVGGPITGRGCDALLIDDPIKNFEDAHSETMREKTWDWFTSTAYTRLEPNGSVIVIQTRWHEDDLTGRILDRLTHEHWKVINFPAIAEDHDAIGRKPGEPLWPARFDLDQLNRIKTTLGSYQWSALYQQRPAPPEGGMFKRSWFQILDEPPADLVRVVRGWDKAASEKEGDASAGALIGVKDGIFWILDVVQGRWTAGERNRIIKQTAELDRLKWGGKLEIWFEQEPGSGGKESAEFSVRDLAGWDVHAEPSTGAKDVRARPFAAQCEAGNVRIIKGEWNQAFLNELCIFPHGAHDDMVDGGALAFNKAVLAAKMEFKWW